MSNNTDNDSVSSERTRDTDSDNVRYKRDAQVEAIAWKLVDKFGDKLWFPFYCKAAYTLSEVEIWRLYDQATSKRAKRRAGHNPAKLFYYLCDRAMKTVR